MWERGTPDAAVASHIEFQYAGIRHQTETAVSGMWLFLTTELLFFGPLFLVYGIYRFTHPAGFSIASAHAELTIGTINTVLLLTSSATFSAGLTRAEAGDNRFLFRACLATAFLGLLFLGLKGFEWKLDFDEGLFPGASFAISGPHAGAAQIFWSWYFIATGLHGLHMIVGIGLVLWVARAARRGEFSPVLFHAGRSRRSLLELCRYGLAGAVSDHLSRRRIRLMRTWLLWLLLLVLAAIEFGVGHLKGGGGATPFIGLLMAVLVAVGFMRLREAPGLAAVFALAGVFWICVLMGLGSMDPATRHDIPVPYPGQK